MLGSFWSVRHVLADHLCTKSSPVCRCFTPRRTILPRMLRLVFGSILLSLYGVFRMSSMVMLGGGCRFRLFPYEAWMLTPLTPLCTYDRTAFFFMFFWHTFHTVPDREELLRV